MQRSVEEAEAARPRGRAARPRSRGSGDPLDRRAAEPAPARGPGRSAAEPPAPTPPAPPAPSPHRRLRAADAAAADPRGARASGARRGVDAARLQPGAAADARPRLRSTATIDLNSVTFEQLRSQNLSVTQATRLLAHRERLGGFSSVDDLDQVAGFPPDLLADLKSRATL